ncbi:hypothetical protein AVEN_210957-2 [Araneus ventricosus]|uniref:Endonuclease/exonuclease/phosphatase domain-containing protein n=1 Tax=Araneus ventricosus TaxID=182803 RepID=A0A4Y2DHK3_ARAVE|nr:hypothetical protein AVEN_210957-2 [Araneus ventricosus]
MHPSRVCEKTPICPSCGDIHSGIWQVPRKCINCQGEHSATSRGCPFYIKEQNIVELKGRIHLTTAAARRIYNQSANFNYAAALKAHTPSNDIEGQINEKMETMLLKMNEKIESITQIINAKMEQVTMLVEMFERLVESLLQNLTAINKLGGVTISPSRKKKSSQQSSQSIWYPNAIGCGFGCFWLGHFGAFFLPVFIFGDFNLYHPLWGSDKSSPLSNDFVEWLQNSSFVLLNSSNPTYATHINIPPSGSQASYSKNTKFNTRCGWHYSELV